jgi:hypothetical protein
MNPHTKYIRAGMMSTSRHGGFLNCSTQEKHAVQSRAPAEVHLQTVVEAEGGQPDDALCIIPPMTPKRHSTTPHRQRGCSKLHSRGLHKTRPAHSRRPKWPLERPGAPPHRTYRLTEVVGAVRLPRGGGWVGWWWSGPWACTHHVTHTTRQATNRRSGASRRQ